MNKIENVVYIITNPQYPGYIKIGYASDLKQRISSLNTGSLSEFIPYAVYETSAINGDLEIHKIIELLNPILRASKFNNNKTKLKEFFKLEPEEAYELLEHIAIVSDTLHKLYKIDACFNKIGNASNEKETTLKKQLIPNGFYTIDRKIKRLGNVHVKATIEVNNEIVILKAGSFIASVEGPGIDKNVHILREKIETKNNILQKDIVCSSLNVAASIAVGSSINVWVNLKNLKGEYIDIYRKNV